MDAFDLPDLLRRQGAHGSPYLEFLRSDALSVGLYVLPAGGHDPQQPHGEDEVYYVAQGSATIHVGGEDRPVRPGSVVFVAAGVDHRFHSITQALAVVVFFAPPEYSARVEAGKQHASQTDV
jgi:mannose-6-phosphate isomerase-like protein (cupin superfamily)